MQIKIPDNFFPPPGVPFTTADQRDVACALATAGLLELEIDQGTKWNKVDHPIGDASPQRYRIAPPKPMVLEFSENYFAGRDYCDRDKGTRLYDAAHTEMQKHPTKCFYVHAKLTATEITDTP